MPIPLFSGWRLSHLQKIPIIYTYPPNTYFFQAQGQVTNRNNDAVYAAISFSAPTGVKQPLESISAFAIIIDKKLYEVPAIQVGFNKNGNLDSISWGKSPNPSFNLSFTIGPSGNHTYNGILNSNSTGIGAGGAFSIYPGNNSGFGQAVWFSSGDWVAATNFSGVILYAAMG